MIGGIKTGANAFFFPNKKLISKYKIPDEYLKPGIKSGRNIPSQFIIENSHISQYFFTIPSSKSSQNIIKDVGGYLNWGSEEKEFPKRPSVNWDPWYSIPKKSQDCPDILFLRHIDKEFKAKYNKAKAIVADGIRGIKIINFNPKKIFFYLGVLNSSFFYWQAHIKGRWEGQGDLQLLVYELKQFDIPNYNEISKQARESVIELWKLIISTNTNCISDNLQKKLDIAVLKTLGLEKFYNVLRGDLKLLETHRISKKL